MQRIRLANIEEEIGQVSDEMDIETKKIVSKRLKKMGQDKICATQFLFNPQSFTQTVENIFSLSFLVKKGAAAVGIRTVEECEALGEVGGEAVLPGPWVKHKKSNDDGGGESEVKETRQCIVSLNMQVRLLFEKMCSSVSVI